MARRRLRWVLLGGVAALLGMVVWALWPEPATAPPPRAREYGTFTACLLTDDKGVTGPAAKPVWDGMQDASLAMRARVQFLEVVGEQTVENAAPFVASLAQTHCDVVFATGEAPSAGVRRSASSFPNVRFYLVGEKKPPANVSTVDASSVQAIRKAVARIVTDAASSRR